MEDGNCKGKYPEWRFSISSRKSTVITAEICKTCEYMQDCANRVISDNLTLFSTPGDTMIQVPSPSQSSLSIPVSGDTGKPLDPEIIKAILESKFHRKN